MDKYSYLKIPLDYVCVYNKLAYCLLAYGVDIIKDCTASCKTIDKDIIKYWNLFQLAITCYDKGEVGKAEYFINYIKANIDRIYKSNVVQNYNGANNYFINEDGRYTCIVCNGWVYEMPNIKIEYNFVLNTKDITDNGEGQKVVVDIISTKTMSDETSSSTENIGYNAIINVDWISYNYQTKELVIKPNAVEYRETQVRFIQNESNKEVVLQVKQSKDATEYEYYFEYEPKEINFNKEGGEVQFTVTKSSKRKLQDSLPVGDEIPVDWAATVKGYGFSYNSFTNKVIAEANDYKERTGELIISRPELGSSKDIKINITQQAGALTIIYTLQAVASQTILPPINAKTALTVISTKQGYYGSEPVGEPEPVSFVISSARGFLTGISQNGAVWSMTENITEVVREDILIITQNSAEGKEVRIPISQQPAVIDYVYTFNTDNPTVRAEAAGEQKTINITFTKQKTINGKNYGDATQIGYSSSITGDFSINQNVITVPQNSEESEKRETATFIQNESNKQFQVTVIQNGAKEEYKYVLTITEGTDIINFTAKGGKITRNVVSTKQRYLNGSPQGEVENVPFEVSVVNNDGEDGFSVSDITNKSFSINANENREAKQRLGVAKIIQSESNKPLQISLTQNAGEIKYEYTLNVEETEINVDNYKHSGLIEYLTITAYREKYIDGVKEGEPTNVNYIYENENDWIHTINYSNVINIDENLGNKRTGVVVIKCEENQETNVKVTIIQKATVTTVAYNRNPTTIYFTSNAQKIVDLTIEKYTLRNGHIKENIQSGVLTSEFTGSSSNFYCKKSGDKQITVAYDGPLDNILRTAYRTASDSFGTYYLSFEYGYIESKTFAIKHIHTNDIINFIYLLIPENYITTYQKLITIIFNNNKEIKDKPNNVINKQLINCWNLFQSAVAAYNLGFIKQADFFIDFINCNVDKIKIIDGKLILELDDGNLKKIINSNKEDIEFNIDFATGQLVQKGETKDNITIKDNYLIQEYGTES